jgi:amino acid adenylation domain-containing protein/non-ribosomal peptide synthase protein (TIGR01720 family)
MLKGVVHDLTGITPDKINTHLTFFEVGVDSLLLIQASQTIRKKFGVEVPLRLLFEDLSTIDALTAYLAEKVPPEALPAEPVAQESGPDLRLPPSSLPLPSVTAADGNGRGPSSHEEGKQFRAMSGEEEKQHRTKNGDEKNPVLSAALERLMARQLQIMSQQLEVMRHGRWAREIPASPATTHATPIHQQPQRGEVITDAERRPAVMAGDAPPASAETTPASTPESFVPYQPIQIESTGGLTPRQHTYLDAFIERYTKRTKESKRLTQTYRPFLAEPRASSGFRLLWKELIYPIIAANSLGPKLWDVDGNEYVDLAMGFGVSLFGHSPSFIAEALEQQLEQGIHLGPQSHLAGPVAELLCELTGMERAIFCNSGTEAVMAALRLARTVTGRAKIAFFAGSYHGSFDGTLARGLPANGDWRSIPMAPGVPPGMVQDVLVLPYANPESLEILKAHAHELAAVLVEPVQSRRPDLQPHAFLQELRQLTEEAGAALIFDEVITGFRIHLGGAQAWFGIQADIATYGKVVGGGLPIGVVAGKAAYMDALDGGWWQFGDGSYPRAPQTFFAGTFCKHPLAMVAAWAVLNQLKSEGPALQQRLNQRTAQFVQKLNAYFQHDQVPIEVGHCGSLFRFAFSRDVKYRDLFWYHLIANGVYVWEGDTRFLSTAHTDEEMESVIRAIQQTVADMREGEFLPAPLSRSATPGELLTRRFDESSKDPVSRRAIQSPESSPAFLDAPSPESDTKSLPTVPLTETQQRLWVLAQMGDDASRAYNESATLHLRGPLNVAAMRKALQQVIDRHEALRTTFSPQGEYQRIHPGLTIDVPLMDFSHLDGHDREAAVAAWLATEVQQPFDLVRGPLLRVRLAKLEEQYHLQVFTIHHLVIDGRSYGVLLRDLAALYSAECQGVAGQLPPPTPFSQYAREQERQEQSPEAAAAEAYWLNQFADSFPILELPTDHPRPPVQTFNVARHCLTLNASLRDELEKLSAQQGCTLFTTLLAGFNALLHQLTGQDDLVVGINALEPYATGGESLIGYRINPLPLRSRIAGDPPLSQYLASVKRTVLDAYEHQSCSFARLIRKVKLRRDPSRPPVAAVFNLDRLGSRLKFFALQVDVVTNPTGAKVDLHWNVVDSDGELLIECDYNADLFDAHTIERWVEHFRILLEDLTTHLAQRFGTLPRLPRPASAPLATAKAERLEFDDVHDRSNLTKYQRLVWAMHKLNPDVPLLNNACLVALPFEVDREHFQKVFQALVNQSDTLRSIIEEPDGEPRRRVLPHAPGSMEYLDLSHASDPQRELRAWVQRRLQTLLDLQTCLFDSVLIKLSEKEFAWYLNQHHTISDAWALALTVRVSILLYLQSIAGQWDGTVELPSFQDYVNYERELVRSPRYLEAEAYWKEKLAEEVEPIAFYGQPPVKQTTRVQRISCELGPERTQELKARAVRKGIFIMSEDVSLFHVFAALLCTYLYRISGNRRLSLGVPFHNRRSKAFKNTIGLLMQIFPLRVTIERDDTFISLIKKIATENMAALRYSEYPVGNPRQKQAYDVECNYVVTTYFGYKEAPATVEWLHPGQGNDSLGLQVHSLGSSRNMVLDFDFHCDIFSEPQRGLAIDHFLQVLDAFLADESQPLRAVNVLSANEKRRILEQFNQTETAFPEDQTVSQLFEAQVRRTPDRVAVQFEDQTVTYAELNARANRLAHHLQALGVGPEMVMGLLAHRSIDFLTAILAVFKAGGAYLPLDPNYPPPRLAQILSQSRSSLALVADQWVASMTTALASLPVDQRPVIVSLGQLLEQNQSIDNLHTGWSPNNLSYVFYTSGSTGVPKGAMIEQAGMRNHIYAKITDFGLTDADVVAQNASQCFDVSVWQFLAILLVGGQVHIVNDEAAHDPLRMLDLMASAEITVLEIVPSQLRAMIDVIDVAGVAKHGLPALRLLFVMGEALLPELCRQWMSLYPRTLFVNGYGTTEVSDDVTHCPITEPPGLEITHMSIGRPLPNMRLYVLDRSLLPTPVGVPGELYIGGICVGRGYLNDAKRTAEVFVPDLFSREPGARLYKTGDLVRYRPDGHIEFLGRIDHQVKIRGFRVELGEIEVILAEHPAVRQTVVVAREDEPGQRRLVAYVVPDGELTPTVSDLGRFLKERLPDYMVPSAFVLLEALPLTTNGKVDRRALPAPETLRPELESAYVAPRTPAEETLAKIWAQILGLDQVGMHDNFFELGGDSILSIQIAARATQAGYRLSPIQLFQHPTIAELAGLADTIPPAPGEQGLVIGPVPLTPIQHWFFDLNVADPHHWNQAILLEVRAALSPSLLERAVQHLLEHHDALRLRFEPTESGWQQFNAGLDGVVPFSRVDLSDLPTSEQPAAVEATAARLQASFNLSEGPLLRVALFDLGPLQSARLLMAIHHLAVDGVSWRILLEDLQTAYQQISRGEAVQLPAKTTSFKQWAERLTEYAQSAPPRQELEYWLAEPRKQVGRLPVDYPDGVNLQMSARTVSVSLSVEETQTLLHEIPKAYNTHINDVLLTALVLAFSPWIGRPSLLVDLEGHGREDLFPDVNLSRTVGWFTAIFPVLLDVGEAGTPVDALKVVKEQLRRIPNRGLGYGVLRYLSQDAAITESLRAWPGAEVSFNYLGQFDQSLPESGPFTMAPESSGPTSSLWRNRISLLEITAFVVQGRLQLNWTYSHNLHRRSTVERVAADYLDALRGLIMQCRSPQAQGYTPSDFAEFKWSQSDLDDITAAISKSTEKVRGEILR